MDGTKVRVLRAVDGDTAVVQRISDGELLRVRLAYIDAPERQQPYGAEATEALRALLFPPPDPDVRSLDEAGVAYFAQTQEARSYGRAVGTLWTHRSGDIGQAMVRGGHAWAYDKYLRRHASERVRRFYLTLQEEARSQRLGLWQAAAEPVPPWEWRRTRRRPYNKGVGCDVCSERPLALVCPRTLAQYCSHECHQAQ